MEADHTIRMADGLDAVREALGQLEQLARGAVAPELRAIGTLARDFAEGDIRTAEMQLRRVLTEVDANLRDAAALAAERALEAALLELGTVESSGNRVWPSGSTKRD